MNNVAHKMLFGTPKVRRTWKVTLSPEKNSARIQQMQFTKKVAKLLGSDYKVDFHFNPGGPAVMGETYIKVWKVDYSNFITHVKSGRSEGLRSPVTYQAPAQSGIVEACLTADGYSYMRQWNGRDSGRNHSISYVRPLDAQAFAMAVVELERRPFIRF